MIRTQLQLVEGAFLDRSPRDAENDISVCLCPPCLSEWRLWIFSFLMRISASLVFLQNWHVIDLVKQDESDISGPTVNIKVSWYQEHFMSLWGKKHVRRYEIRGN